MATLVTTKPTYAVPNRPTTVIFQPSNGATNFIRVWATTAPEGTAIREQIDANKLKRALVYQGNAGPSYPWRTTFEKGGAYSLTIQEYTKGNTWGGGYDRDPRGAPTETKNGAEQTTTLYIAQRMTQTIGVNPDSAELVLYMVNQTVRPTLEAVHGEATPSIQSPSSDKAAAAANEAAVLTALSDLHNASTSTLGYSDIAANLNVILTYFESHAENVGGTWHQAADEQTDLVNNYALPNGATQAGIAATINKLRQRYSLHIENATEASPTPGSITIHQQTLRLDVGARLLPITADGSDPATIFGAYADFARAQDVHRVSGAHETADTAWPIGPFAVGSLARMHYRFLQAITQPFATPPPGQTSGAVGLMTYAGFEET